MLRVKEYWQEIDPNSLYYKNYAMVDVTELMTIGDSSSVNLVDLNGQIKRRRKFKENRIFSFDLLHLPFQADTIDDDGLP